MKGWVSVVLGVLLVVVGLVVVSSVVRRAPRQVGEGGRAWLRWCRVRSGGCSSLEVGLGSGFGGVRRPVLAP